MEATPNMAAFLDWTIRAAEFVMKYEKDPAQRERARGLIPIAAAAGELFLRFRKGQVAALGIFTPINEEILAGQYVLIAPKFRPAPDLLFELLGDALAVFPARDITYERRHSVLVTPSLKPRITKCPPSPAKSEKAATPPSANFKARFLDRWRASGSLLSSSSSSSPQDSGIPPWESPSSSSSKSSERQVQLLEDSPSDELDVEPEPFRRTW